MEDSPIGLDKWLMAMWLIVNCKNGISSYEVHRALGITQKSAWFLDHRIRLALHQGSFEDNVLKGEVEADETYTGGKGRNIHAAKKVRTIKGRGPEGKIIVGAVLERGGKVRARVVDGRRKRQLHELVKRSAHPGSTLYSDELKSYDGLEPSYIHETVAYAVEYLRGNVHTNSAENFWSVLKRGVDGTYISDEPFHLFRYLDENPSVTIIAKMWAMPTVLNWWFAISSASAAPGVGRLATRNPVHDRSGNGTREETSWERKSPNDDNSI